jgi:hypothetical protein
LVAEHLNQINIMMMSYEQNRLLERAIQFIHPDLNIYDDYPTNTTYIIAINKTGHRYTIECPYLPTMDNITINEKLVPEVLKLLEKNKMKPCEAYQNILDRREEKIKNTPNLTCEILDI